MEVDLLNGYELITINDEMERMALAQIAGDQLSILIADLPFGIITKDNTVVAVLKE